MRKGTPEDYIVFRNAINNGVYGNNRPGPGVVSQVNRALLQTAEKKLHQRHYALTLDHNVAVILDKNIFSLVTKGTASNNREGESVFLENISIRMCYTPFSDRPKQTFRFIAYLTTPGTPAVDTIPVDPSQDSLANPNVMIQTINEDACKLLTDRIITIDREQSGALVGGTREYPGLADWVPEWIGGNVLKGAAQAPTSYLNFKIPINRKLTYVNNTLLLGNNVLNMVVVAYEALGTLTSDHIGRVEASLTLHFKDAP